MAALVRGALSLAGRALAVGTVNGPTRGSIRRVVLTGFFFALAGASAPAPSLAIDAPIVFSATGDVPYGDAEVPIFQDQVNHHNVYSPSDFFVHLGDIKSGSET